MERKVKFNNIPVTYNNRSGHPIVSQYNFGDIAIHFYNEAEEDVTISDEYCVAIWRLNPKKRLDPNDLKAIRFGIAK